MAKHAMVVQHDKSIDFDPHKTLKPLWRELENVANHFTKDSQHLHRKRPSSCRWLWLSDIISVSQIMRLYQVVSRSQYFPMLEHWTLENIG